MRAALYLDAARRIKPDQALGRLRRLIAPALLATHTGTAPGWRPIAAGLGGGSPPQSASGPPPHTDRVFRAFARERSAGAVELWDDESDGLLFLFHLHGFESLARYVGSRRTAEGDAFWEGIVRSWLDAGAKPALPAWHPAPTSARLIAWSSALSAEWVWPQQLEGRMRESAWKQLRYLSRAIERDIGGNHVIRNAAALVVGGAVFESVQIRDRGLRLVERELERQVLADGGHEERSTAYQQVVAADLADMIAVCERTGLDASRLSATLARLNRWSAAVAGPDGLLPLLNDAWECPPVADRVEDSVTVLEPSGIRVARDGGDQIVFDVGPLAPGHLPPHAHADALSVVAWFDGSPLLVDPGSFEYSGPRRNEFRATAAHNTVEVDGVDQCRFWGDFRLAFPPRVTAAAIETVAGATIFRGRHDGYRRLDSPAVHERTVVWWPGQGFVILDRLLGEGAHAIRSRLHLAPGIIPERDGTAGPVRIHALGAETRVIASAYSPFFGSLEQTAAFEDARTVGPGIWFGWSVLRPGAEVAELAPQRVELSAPGKRRLVVGLANE